MVKSERNGNLLDYIYMRNVYCKSIMTRGDCHFFTIIFRRVRKSNDKYSSLFSVFFQVDCPIKDHVICGGIWVYGEKASSLKLVFVVHTG